MNEVRSCTIMFLQPPIPPGLPSHTPLPLTRIASLVQVSMMGCTDSSNWARSTLHVSDRVFSRSCLLLSISSSICTCTYTPGVNKAATWFHVEETDTLLLGGMSQHPRNKQKCISETDMLRQSHVLQHWDRCCRSNLLSQPVTVR